MSLLARIIEEDESDEWLVDEQESSQILPTEDDLEASGDTYASLSAHFSPYPTLALENFLTDDNGVSFVEETGNDFPAAGSEIPSASAFHRISSRVFSSMSVDSVTGHFSEHTGQRTFTLRRFCDLIAECASLERAKILSVECYKEWSTLGVPHRTLILHLRREKRSDVWLRVDRRRSHSVSGAQFLRRGGKTEANDVVHLAGIKANLLRQPTMKPENWMEFHSPPNLGTFRWCLHVICEELLEYHIWPENCWFMCSLLQEHLFETGQGYFRRGSHIRPGLATSIRLRVRNRVHHLVPLRPTLSLQATPALSRPVTYPRLALCSDLGSNTSSVGIYYHKSPSAPPIIAYVDAWPGQDMSVKHVPSALVYDSDRQVRFESCGANAYSPETNQRVDADGWYRIERLNMHMPTDLRVSTDRRNPEELPLYIGLHVVYRDWLRYLLLETQRFFEHRAGVDPDAWAMLLPFADILITHPNGWGDAQQAFLQEVAIEAGIVSVDDVCTRLRFTEKSEAVACYCVPEFDARPKVGMQFLICDAGRSATHISRYETQRSEKGVNHLQELHGPLSVNTERSCIDKRFQAYLEDMLMSLPQSKDYHIPECIKSGMRSFEQGAKRQFLDVATTYDVQLGARLLTVPEYGIKCETLSLKGYEITTFPGISRLTAQDQFSTVVRTFFDAIMQQLEDAVRPYYSVPEGVRRPDVLVLTGGLGNSRYIKRELERTYSPKYIFTFNPPTGKAVSVGGMMLMTASQDLVRVKRDERTRAARTARFIKKILGAS